MDTKYINAVCRASENIFKNYFGMQAVSKEPWEGNYSVNSNRISVIIGVNGDLDGQIIATFDLDIAKKIIGTMMGGMEIKELDDMGWSAIQEFGNWIAGTTATELSTVGAVCDVTTPILNEGPSKFRSGGVFIMVPMETDLGEFEINISLKPEK